MMKTTEWHGCYDSSHKGLVVLESFKHPAKMSVGLCERIFEYGREMGYWKPGDVIVDPFYGIGTTGLVGAYRGYQVIGVELEGRFVDLGRVNAEYNRRKLEGLGRPVPVVVQGDSRHLRFLIGDGCGAAGTVTSPPFSAAGTQAVRSEMQAQGRDCQFVYGAVTSPPYAESAQSKDGEFVMQPTAVNPTPRRLDTRNYYPAEMSAEGQIGAMPVGAVTSPPYANSLEANNGIDASKIKSRYGAHTQALQNTRYGSTEGQMGAMNTATYWQAVAQVYAELFQVIRPGGAAAIVVKDYVKDGKRVTLCDQTVALLEGIGYRVVERVRAMLVKEWEQGTDMFGEARGTRRIERKSFFRRLAEKKGAPKIDWEEVIWAEVP